MAELIAKPRIELNVQLKLNEQEARAWKLITEYGEDDFIARMKTLVGEAQIRECEGGLRSFFRCCKEFLPGILSKTDQARDVFSGELLAIHPDSNKLVANSKAGINA